MAEAINKYYLEDGNIDKVEMFVDDESSKSNIIYEVLRITKGTPLFLKEHLKRMENSFEIIGKEFPFTYEKINEYIVNLITANSYIDGNIKITYNTLMESLKVYYIPHKYPEKELYDKGVKVTLFYGERNNPNAKIIDSTFRKIVDKQIIEENAYEAILVDRNGNITEGSKSNIFFIKEGKLMTPPAGTVLKGVTRQKVLLIAKNLNIESVEIEIKEEELDKIEALFISGTSPKILPICKVDEREFDINNKILRGIIKSYEEIMSENIKSYKK